ncbi:hypothetical protein Pelo_9874 [Pelomyxa schiedti]|nr:hypothetical protein Pelo_9874 [Pelomyxa schiedti]
MLSSLYPVQQLGSANTLNTNPKLTQNLSVPSFFGPLTLTFTYGRFSAISSIIPFHPLWDRLSDVSIIIPFRPWDRLSDVFASYWASTHTPLSQNTPFFLGIPSDLVLVLVWYSVLPVKTCKGFHHKKALTFLDYSG